MFVLSQNLFSVLCSAAPCPIARPGQAGPGQAVMLALPFWRTSAASLPEKTATTLWPCHALQHYVVAVSRQTGAQACRHSICHIFVIVHTARKGPTSRWALSMLLSRLIRLAAAPSPPLAALLEPSATEASRDVALVPWADFVNHSPGCSAFVSLDADMAAGGAVVLRADRNYIPGQQVRPHGTAAPPMFGKLLFNNGRLFGWVACQYWPVAKYQGPHGTSSEAACISSQRVHVSIQLVHVSSQQMHRPCELGIVFPLLRCLPCRRTLGTAQLHVCVTKNARHRPCVFDSGNATCFDHKGIRRVCDNDDMGSSAATSARLHSW